MEKKRGKKGGGCTKEERGGKRKGEGKREEKREAKECGERLKGAFANCKKKRTFS